MPCWVLFCRLIIMVIIYPQGIRQFFLMVHDLSSRKWLYHITKSLQTCHSFPIAFVARSFAIHLLPFPFPWKIWVGNTQKSTHISFWPFFPLSDVSLFHTRSSTQEKIPSVFVLLSHSLKLLVNEDWGSLYKFHPRKKWNASSDLASFHARKRIWIGVSTV